MAQRDYVSRGRSSGAQRRSNGRKKKTNNAGASKTMIVLALGVLVTFIMGILVIVHHHESKEDAVVKDQSRKAGNSLPPKPEERWNYIKELENRQTGVSNAKAPVSTAEKSAQAAQQQLTPEQRELLAQMQADMRQPPTQLAEVPANGPNQRASQGQQMPVSNPSYTQNPQPQVQQQSVQHQQPHNPFNQQTSVQKAPVAKTEPQQQQNNAVAPAAKNQAPIRREVVPASKPASIPKAPAPAPVSVATPASVEKAKPKDVAKTTPQASGQKWFIQCGSFRNKEQAESVRVKLAFSGIESRINSSGEWHRVVLGPYNERGAANNMISRLNGSGTSGCITMASKG